MTSANIELGESLLAKGWSQGTLFSAPSVRFVSNKIAKVDTTGLVNQTPRKTEPQEKFVLITQTCDIKESVDKEPYVEALICEKESNQERLDKVDRNSARWFVIDRDMGLVAKAMHRVQISKKVLEILTPEQWPSDQKRFERFVRWLARRYDRPAIPDLLVECFQDPLNTVFTRLSEEKPDVVSAFNRAVHEVRVSLPASENPPFDLHLLLLARKEGVSEEEVDAIETVFKTFESELNPEMVHVEWEQPRSEEEISMAQYFATRPLFLEYLTFKGEEVEGLEPPPRL